MKLLPVHIASLTGNKNALKKIIDTVPRRVLEIKDNLGRTPLILTAMHNYIECGSLLLKAGVHVDNSDNAGQTALHIAASKGFYRFVKLLLSQRASWMQRDYCGVTALHMAAIHPNVKCLSAILKYLKPGETDIQDSTLKTSLHWSAAYAYNAHVKLLLAQDANICIPDEDGKTPLHWVAANPDPEALECVKSILKKEQNVINWQDYQGRSALHIAVATGSEEVLYYLVSQENCNIDVLDNSFCTPLHWAAKKGFSEKADILLKKRANHSSADDYGAMPLHYAAHNNQVETVEVFMSRHYINDDEDKLGRNALIWAAVRNSEAALKVLAANCANVTFADKKGATALHAAAVQGHLSIIELLVSFGVPIDITDKNGMTPFLKTCEAGRSKAAQLFLDLGANIHATDSSECSALHWCAKGGHAYLCQILLKRGANCNAQDSLRMTPLHYASAFGDYINCASVLLESGADPNVVDIEGKTALHAAVINERKGVVRLLSEHSSDVNALFLMNDWATPLDCSGLNDITELLKSYGGISAQNIKVFAAKIIQAWFRRKRRKKLYCYALPKFADVPSKIIFESPSIDTKCFPFFKLPLGFQRHLKDTSNIYHECKGCYHKIECRHICTNTWDHHKSPAEMKAASIIQRTWKKYIMKKRFSKIRNEIANTFPSQEVRMLAEEFWQRKLQYFYNQL